MTSDLSARLLALADSAETDVERWTLRAQWACAMARLGRIDVARTEVASLRSRNSSYVPTLTAWILLAEGTADHFESLSSTAIDRFKRARGLAMAIGDDEIRGVAAAWMGASEFLMAQYESGCLHALEAIRCSSESNTLARSRAHLVLANCLNAVGLSSLAARHYSKARQHAVEARDISMQSAILYNVAAFHVSRLCEADAFGEPCEDELGIAELELNSISNLDTGIGLGSLTAMVPLLRAQLLLIKRSWHEAEAIYSHSVDEAAAHGQQRIAARYLAEHAHCLAMLRQFGAAMTTASSALTQITDRTDMDDRAACHARLALCLSCLGNLAESERQRLEALRCRSAFAEFQEAHRDRILSIASEAV